MGEASGSDDLELSEEDEELNPSEDEGGEKGEKTEDNLYQTLGESVFKDLKSLKVTSSWVGQATNFPSIINEFSSKALDEIPLPEPYRSQSTKLIKSWFPVQYSVLPSLLGDISRPQVLRPRDIAIAAPTGSGKTLCYVLPILAAARRCSSNILYAVIIVPAQALVKQIDKEFEKWNCDGLVKVLCLSGATEFESESRKLETCQPNVIIATPSRFVQHLTSKIPSPMDLTRLRYIVADEADRMGSLLRHEWLDIVEDRSKCVNAAANIGSIVATRRSPQKIVLSATLSKDVEELHLWNLFRPRLFCATSTKSEEMKIDHVSGSLALPEAIQHKLLVGAEKFHPLVVYHNIMQNKWNRILVFVKEVQSSNRLASVLKDLCEGTYTVEYFTSSLFGKRRHVMLKRFETGQNRIMIASDALARGVDIEDIDCVINYNLPTNDKLFVHRAGRTGRAGRNGHVLSISDKEQKRIFVKMLAKTGLNSNFVEEEVQEDQFEGYMDRYKAALDKLKETVQSNGKQRGQNAAKRSGFEGNRKRRNGRRQPANEEPFWKKAKRKANDD